MKRDYLNYAFIVFIIAILFTAYGGYLDYQENSTITKEHFWNDGQFLAIAGIGLLLVAYHT